MAGEAPRRLDQLRGVGRHGMSARKRPSASSWANVAEDGTKAPVVERPPAQPRKRKGAPEVFPWDQLPLFADEGTADYAPWTDDDAVT